MLRGGQATASSFDSYASERRQCISQGLRCVAQPNPYANPQNCHAT